MFTRHSSTLILLATLLVLAMLLPASVLAQDPALTVGSAAGQAGTAVNLSVSLTAGAIGVSTLQFDLGLPSGVSSPNPPSVSTGSAATTAGKSASAGLQPSGAVRVLIFGLNQNTIASGTLATVNLNIAPGTAPGTLGVVISGIVCSDAGGNNVTATGINGSIVVAGTVDTTPPTISGVASSGISGSSATISWATNEASDTQVEYGATTTYGSSTALSASLVTSHSQILSGLTTGTSYHYRARSRDAAGNLAVSSDRTLTTTSQSLPAPTNVRLTVQ